VSPGSAANVIVCEDDALNVTVAVPTDQLAEVELFVHEPDTVQFSDPKAMYDVEEMLTLPVTVTVPDVDSRAPPPRVRFPLTVRAFVPFVRLPELMFNVDAVMAEDSVMVPVMVKVAKD
jgi:hypothetical protein